MPQHHMLLAGLYILALAVVIICTALFWRGTHDSPFPTPEPTVTDLGQLPLLEAFDD